MSYPDSVSYLYSLGNEVKPGAKLDLAPMRRLLEALGNPEAEQRFIHAAGTNGKGSTCAMLASILRESGLHTGLYTSPHLIEPTERIRIDGADVSRDEFKELFATVHACAEALVEQGTLEGHPSYFETVTAMALCAFAQSCDIGVIEVGLGGRLDATNVIRPQLTIVTPIDYDHEALLGNTLAAIAFEKAGILKENVTTVISPQDPAAMDVITHRARELNCRMVQTEGVLPEKLRLDSNGSTFVLGSREYRCPLAGAHQVTNAVTAIVAAQELSIAESVIQAGLAKTQWPGRLEYASRSPDFILDGAHNPAGARALAAYIQEVRNLRPVWLVFGAMRDKAVDEVVSQLFPLADRVILTAPNMPRALRPESLEEMYAHDDTQVAASVAEALKLAQSAAPETMIFITGSLYLVGEARKLLRGDQ